MDIKEQIKYWTEISEYDLSTADVMLKNKRYLYVGFMCHQTIEKILKAYFVSAVKEIPPYIHNLTKLSKLSGLNTDLSEDQKGVVLMDKKQALESVKEYSILIRSILDPYKIYLFGSYAKGTWNDLSDIDVAIIVKGLDKDYLEVLQSLYKLRRQVNDSIEPVLLDFYHDPSGFMQDIMKNGEEIV